MRSLFLRIFLWFWTTLALVWAALSFSTQFGYTGGQAQRDALLARIFPAEAKASAEILENSDAAALRQYLARLEGRFPVQVFFFTEDQREVLDRNPPSAIRDLASLVATRDRLVVIVNLAGYRVAGPSGRVYSFVSLLEPGEQFRRENGRQFIVRRLSVFVILIAATLFCYFVARQVTRPVLDLRAAAASIAEGRLDARVNPRWKRRKDEIGGLSRDFDLMAERIEALMAGQRRLLGDVSHELRSPLARLMVALGLLKKRSQPEGVELLDRVGIEAHRLDKLIGQLLTLSRIDSGLHVGSQLIDLANLVQEVARDADFEARANGRSVEVNAVDACSTRGSEELIRSAIENVVRNAVRHTQPDTSVEISLYRRGEQTLVRVRDRGPGVPESRLSEIFIPFRRIDPAASNGDGAGLGLAITERAVRLHGGRVHAMNLKDGGLIVEIELPAEGGR